MTLQDMLSYFSNLICSFLPMMFLVGLVANQLQILLLLMQVTVVRLAVFHLHWLLTGGTQAGFVWMYLNFSVRLGSRRRVRRK
ncbi:hypothetical protein Krac_11392 [Ktedonobacter racemifer DSM 44963]|uniref:Uncharacterized protein n=1 Tax=Ktedonobacter racemifer DSM 44963 TaxID=485913 RepID=D6TBN6_KTERA|nr:hypothetical protein Krac_11392 [Ktedonobacter racemifer DSM 44963]